MLTILILALAVWRPVYPQNTHRVGRLHEVYGWKQLTYNIKGVRLQEDLFSADGLRRHRRADDTMAINDTDTRSNFNYNRPGNSIQSLDDDSTFVFPTQRPDRTTQRPVRPTQGPRRTTQRPTSTSNPNSDAGRFFIQYNNVPMGVERYKDRLFVTVPRRRHGIPSTLNYLDLKQDTGRSPSLRPYPDFERSRSMTSVYRTRVDSCDRLWMVDTGRHEIPNAHNQVTRPAIVVFDLKTDRQILRYELKVTDTPQENTPAGLASITVEIVGNCNNAFAYIPDLATYGLIVYSMRENDSWRLTHNYFHFSPTSGELNVAGQRFQWNDGIFSITLTQPNREGCRTGYFHAMASTQEFSISTCLLRNRTWAEAGDWNSYSVVGDRGANGQSTMHGYHAPSNVVFFANIARNAVTCWRASSALTSSNVGTLAQDSQLLSYPADLHVTGDEVWVLSNTLPRFIYSRYDVNEYNFHIYRAQVRDFIAGTICDGLSSNLLFE